MNREEFVVDRIEGDEIIIESSGELITISKLNIDRLPKEGDVLERIGEKFIIDNNATIKRKERINNLMKGMWAE